MRLDRMVDPDAGDIVHDVHHEIGSGLVEQATAYEVHTALIQCGWFVVND